MYSFCRLFCTIVGEGEGEVAFFSAKRWDRRNRADLIESATPCHDAQALGPYRDSNPLGLTILAAMSEDYTTAPRHFHELFTNKESLAAWRAERTFLSFGGIFYFVTTCPDRGKRI